MASACQRVSSNWLTTDGCTRSWCAFPSHRSCCRRLIAWANWRVRCWSERQNYVMKIKIGYQFICNFPQATPMILMTNIHYSRASDIIVPDYLTTDPAIAIIAYRDGFGNWCNRIVAPPGRIRLAGSGVVRDAAAPDTVVPFAIQHAVQDLPEETLVFLLGSRYCETDRLSDIAWGIFHQAPAGWAR